jgi:hypothetical protein
MKLKESFQQNEMANCFSTRDFFSLSVSSSRINGNHVIDIHAWELLNGGSRLYHDWKK